jgi:hypothetical protein
MYKFSAEGLDDKIKYIKPFSFFESVREKFKKANLEENFLDAKKSLEESTVVENDDFKKKAQLTKEIYENKIAYMSRLYSKINKANDRIEKKAEFITESFNRNLFEEKMNKDLVYFKHILENVLPSGESKVYQELHETVYELMKEALIKTIELYEETNVKPRYLTPALNAKNIEETKIIDLYNTHFKKYLTENYIIPLRKGKIEELNESEDIKQLTRYLIENGIEENIDNIIAYLPFEKRVKEFLENVLIPEPARKKIEYFIESQDLAYFDIYEKNAKTIYESLEDIIEKIASIISPFLFKNSVDIDTDEEMNPLKYAGVSIMCRKVNDGPMVCKVKKEETGDDKNIEDVEDDENIEDIAKEVEKIAEKDAEVIKEELKDELEADAIMSGADDKDNDGIPDVEEDHGELPEDFEGDHEDAEELKDEEEKEEKEEKVKKEKKEEKKKEKEEKTKEESTVVEETEAEPGVAKTKVYDKEKALQEADKEEVVPDEADDFKKIDDEAKEEK